MNRIPRTEPFRALERALTRRRLKAIDPWLRAELALLALLLCAVMFWKLRVPLDGLAHARGPWVTLAVALALMVAIAASAGVLTAVRRTRALRRGPAGPEWLALPCELNALDAHFAWHARALAPIAALPAATVLLALAGLVHPLWIAALAVLFTLLVWGSVKLALALGARLGAPRHASARSLPPIAHALASPREVARTTKRHERPPAVRGAGFAMLVQDVRLARHTLSARSRAIALLLFVAIAALPWFAPWAPRLAHAAAFALALIAAAAAADWVIAVTALHPAGILRSLPLGVTRFWGTRAMWIVISTAVLLAVQLLAARRLEPAAWRVLIVWLGGAALVVGLLGANLAVTLHPRGDVASRVLSLWLSLAMVASFIIPLLGWVLVFTATIHSARRLPRWARAEAI